MISVLGIDSEFCNVEALVTGIVDNWPDTLLKHRRIFTGKQVLQYTLPMAGIHYQWPDQTQDFHVTSLTSKLINNNFRTDTLLKHRRIFTGKYDAQYRLAMVFQVQN